MTPSLQAAEQYVELLSGDPQASVHVRIIHDSDKSQQTGMRFGAVRALWPELLVFQRQGYGIFAVVNEGGNRDGEITRIRAAFVDADGIPLPASWHLTPDFTVRRDATHWHAYWIVNDLPVAQFREVQRRLAAHYGTDPAVCNPSRVMRLPGTLHQKGANA